MRAWLAGALKLMITQFTSSDLEEHRYKIMFKMFSHFASRIPVQSVEFMSDSFVTEKLEVNDRELFFS
jgi:hypothetical protein